MLPSTYSSAKTHLAITLLEAREKDPKPLTVINVPPSDGPLLGHTSVNSDLPPTAKYRTSPELYSNPFKLTATLALPGTMAIVRHNTKLEDNNVPCNTREPILTVHAGLPAPCIVKPRPTTVTTFPPTAGPALGTSPVTI
jgi:hypothetical protein